MSKGGLAYEVILAEPVGVPVPRRADSPEKTPSVEEIQEKLKAAEERRRVSGVLIPHHHHVSRKISTAGHRPSPSLAKATGSALLASSGFL